MAWEKGVTEAANELRFEQKRGDTFVPADLDGGGRADFKIKREGQIDLNAGGFILEAPGALRDPGAGPGARIPRLPQALGRRASRHEGMAERVCRPCGPICGSCGSQPTHAASVAGAGTQVSGWTKSRSGSVRAARDAGGRGPPHRRVPSGSPRDGRHRLHRSKGRPAAHAATTQNPHDPPAPAAYNAPQRRPAWGSR